MDQASSELNSLFDAAFNFMCQRLNLCIDMHKYWMAIAIRESNENEFKYKDVDPIRFELWILKVEYNFDRNKIRMAKPYAYGNMERLDSLYWEYQRKKFSLEQKLNYDAKLNS